MSDRTKKRLALLSACSCVLSWGPGLAGPTFAEDSPKTAWGAPDLRGTWDFRTITPMERPAAFKDKEFFTPDEAEEFEEAVRQGRAERAARAANEDPVLGQGDVDVGYDSFFLDLGDKASGTLRTSLVVDPPDGRVPPLTDDAKQRARQRYERWGGAPAGPEDRNPNVRCITGFNSGPPMTPGAYNNITQIFQTEDHVSILNEMVNDHRIIPLDGRPHLPEDIRLWKGDSRGHWDGDTLVVTTKNFTEHTAFRGTGRNLLLTERFTRLDDDSLLYEYTVDDPDSYQAPWSTALEMRRTDDLIYEYACHEGNIAMMLMLRGARIQELKGEEKDQWLATWYKGAAAAVQERDEDEQ
jgi:hypothetical protein